jgi:glycosyltransferase involved in cell wall biosynthesis
MAIAWRFSVVIPAFNEAASIARVVADVAALPGPVEVIVVDDGSTDGTADEIARVQRCLPIVSLRLAGNRGKGAAVRAGIARASAPVVVLHDADLEYHPASLLALVEPIERGLADAVYGSRFLGPAGQATGPIHRCANWLLTWFSNRFTGLRLTDMETGQKAFRRAQIQGLLLAETRFGIEPEITAKLARAGCRIMEIPVSYSGRSRAAGKKIGVRDGLWTIVCIMRYSWRS